VALLRLPSLSLQRPGSGRGGGRLRGHHRDAPAATRDRSCARLARRAIEAAEGWAGRAPTQRLTTRLEQLRKQHEWGDIGDEDYRAKRRETELLLANVPDADKLVVFDKHRTVIETMAENLDRATPAQKAELVRLLAERIVARGRTVAAVDIKWAGPVRPFFAVGAPPDGLEPPTQALGRPRSVH
jgi:hypothetical protein